MSHTGDKPQGIPFESDIVKIINNSGRMLAKLTNEIVEKIKTCVHNRSGWSFTHRRSLKVVVAK